jgi:hypothetical protein
MPAAGRVAAVDICVRRWWVWHRLLGTALYVNHFTAGVGSQFHAHPENFMLAGLRGCCLEDLPSGATRAWCAPWVCYNKAPHTHRVRVPYGGCWVLVFIPRLAIDKGETP